MSTDERAGLSEAERDALRMVMETSSTSWLNLRRRVETAVERIITDRLAAVVAERDAAVARVEAAEAEVRDLLDVHDANRELLARVAAVEVLHAKDGAGDWCLECDMDTGWPCATATALAAPVSKVPS